MKRALILALVVLGWASAQALTIKHTEPRRMDHTAFTRFGQLLGHDGATDPTRVALFSDAKSHDGLFFVTELDTQIGQLPAGTIAVLEVMVEKEQKPLETRFEIPASKSHSKTLYLGLTQAPFNSCNKRDLPRILAWKVSLLDAEGKVLSAAPSAVWQY